MLASESCLPARAAMWFRVLAAGAMLGASAVADAHTLATPEGSRLDTGTLIVAVLLLIAAALYAAGVRNLWRNAGLRRGIGIARVLAFAVGWVSLSIALVSPFERLGAELFTFHMIQHEVLMLVSAPLVVLGRPLAMFVWAWPPLGRVRPFPRIWAFLMMPLTAWCLHALALWIWHIPAFFSATLVDRALHDLQHVTFLGTALLFWTALFDARAREAQGAAILYLFTTTIHTGVLGALITFAPAPLYTPYLATALAWGLSALEDQQLGGLIMWVPASLVYIGAALCLLAQWIIRSERLA